MAYTNSMGEKYVTNWTKSLDVFAMGWLIRQICGDFFTDISKDEMVRYDEEKWKMGFPLNTTLPHETHKACLYEALDAMLHRDISKNYLQDKRKTAEWWAHYFKDQLMVDPIVCMWSIESKPLAKSHPDGPRDVMEDRW
ncbi:hypothetical protein R1flu_004391 [Riccia fluitans]|uniref:Uncharacterized protein n=1 Tax=Riccia fluitans TaxID=41844 RepID=A0ABD1YQ55_9MARC